MPGGQKFVANEIMGAPSLAMGLVLCDTVCVNTDQCVNVLTVTVTRITLDHTM